MDLVEVENLVIKYQDLEAVKGISFTVPEGTIMGVLGGNGAGKSSTLRTLASVTPFNDGMIGIDGVPLNTPENIDYARKIVGYCPDVGGLIPQATIKEHIALLLSLHDKSDLWDQAEYLVDYFNLYESMNKPTKGFSHGMCRRLSVILAALGSEKLLILDEPYDGVDPLGVEKTMELIKEAKSNGLSVIISTHLQSLLTESCDDIIVMSKGEIISRGVVDHYQGEEGQSLYHNLLEEHVDNYRKLAVNEN